MGKVSELFLVFDLKPNCHPFGGGGRFCVLEIKDRESNKEYNKIELLRMLGSLINAGCKPVLHRIIIIIFICLKQCA